MEGESNIEVDGSVMEGGGQIVRNATAFSALLRRPITVHNVRGNRPSPGLKPQHTSGILLAAEICSASTSGVNRQSRTYSFHPGDIHLGDYTSDIGTAGSITLLLQLALPCLLFAGHPRTGDHRPPCSHLNLRGGSNVTNSPQVEYVEHVLFPFLHRHFRLSTDQLIAKTLKPGFWPKGGGVFNATIPALPSGQALPSVDVTDRGEIFRLCGVISHQGTSRQSVSVLQNTAIETLRSEESIAQLPSDRITIYGLDPPKTSRDKTGHALVLWAETSTGCIIGGSAIGKKGADCSTTGREAAEDLLRNLRHGGCVDEYLQDQIIILIALAKGRSRIKTGPLTEHTRTAMWIAELMCGANFEVETQSGGSLIICCDGIGLEGRFNA